MIEDTGAHPNPASLLSSCILPLIASPISFEILPCADLLCVPLRAAQRELQGSSSTGASLHLLQCNPFPPAHAADIRQAV